jgi:hypothetical protein
MWYGKGFNDGPEDNTVYVVKKKVIRVEVPCEGCTCEVCQRKKKEQETVLQPNKNETFIFTDVI